MEVLKSTIDLGGWVDLLVLRREATQPADRVARVQGLRPGPGPAAGRPAPTSPSRCPASPSSCTTSAPTLLRRGVRAGLRRCYCQFWLPWPEPDPEDPTAPVLPATGPVDLTAYSGGWLRLPQQVLDVVDPEAAGARGERGRLAPLRAQRARLLVQPLGAGNAGPLGHRLPRRTSRWSTAATRRTAPPRTTTSSTSPSTTPRPWPTSSSGGSPAPQLETVAAESRQATQPEAAAEATRMAAAHCPWLFVPSRAATTGWVPSTGLAGAGGRAGRASLAGARG